METNLNIGFIGQGWIGKNYADDFEERGFKVTRYSMEPQYVGNKDAIAGCDIVLIAVPTPTTPDGFDDSVLRQVIPLVGKGKIAVMKSTTVPGKTKELQEAFPDVTLLYSPEFLSEATAKQDTSHPFSSIVGFPKDTPEHRKAAELVLSVLPKAPYSQICSSTEAEMIKYSHNISGYIQIIFYNMMYDLANSLNCDWNAIQEAITHDPFMSAKYSQPIHKSGRGAGGHCFIKDFEAFYRKYKEVFPHDLQGHMIFKGNINKNIELLLSTNKDVPLLQGVYGNMVEMV
jgi:UDPglucose 6-dehydrogenase